MSDSSATKKCILVMSVLFVLFCLMSLASTVFVPRKVLPPPLALTVSSTNRDSSAAAGRHTDNSAIATGSRTAAPSAQFKNHEEESPKQAAAVHHQLTSQDDDTAAKEGPAKGKDWYVEKETDRVQPLQKACPMYKTIRRTVVSGYCDICQLVPLLEAYADEVDTVVEAGSRAGLSTNSLMNRHVRRLRCLEIRVSKQLAKLHHYYDTCTRSEESTRGDTGIVVGDDVQSGVPFPSVPLLFLDTLHNGDQLYKELEVLTLPVTQWITFHDTYSYKARDELFQHRRSDVPAVVSKWEGLALPIRHFLAKYKDEWVEEMNYVHNNGFYVLRRRNFTLTVHPPHPQRIEWLDLNAREGLGLGMEVSSATAGTVVEKTFNFVAELRKVQHLPDELACRSAYKAFARSKPHGLCRLLPHDQFEYHLHGFLLAQSDTLYVAKRLGVLFGYSHVGPAAFVVDTTVSRGGGTSTDSTGNGPVPAERLLGIVLDIFSLVSVISGQVGNKSTLLIVPLPHSHSDCEVCQTLKEKIPEFKNAIEFRSDRESAPTVFVGAWSLKHFAADETFGATARIVVFGSAISDAGSYRPKGFVLQTVLNGATGVVVWEKEDSYYGHYYTPGSSPPLVDDVPRESATFRPGPR